MFTGIIEKVAQVRKIEQTSENAFALFLSQPFQNLDKGDEIVLGESIATNGTCLTVAALLGDEMKFDLSPETIHRTSLSRLKTGSKVNLERSLKMGGRLSGHWVQGHVDGTAKLSYLQEVEKGYFDITVEPLDEKLLKYCVKKGSITLDGISLTIHEIERNQLKFQIIPHTWEQTALSDLKLGDLLNIEVDLLAKYIERFNDYKNGF